MTARGVYWNKISKVIEMEKKQLEEERQKLEEEKVDKSIFSYSNKNTEHSKPRR